MAEPTLPRLPADRNRLFGILAWRLDFVSREAMVQGLHAWALEKRHPLGQVLVEQGDLSPDDRLLLEEVVRRHLARHGSDPAASLAAISSPGLMDSVDEERSQIADADASARHPPTGDSAPLPFPTDEAPAARAPSLGAPTSLGLRYRILRAHATGGLGRVSVALDGELRREVALKEIQEPFADDPTCRARFRREAEVTGRLEHPGIVPVHGLGVGADGRPFYVMRLIKGESLQDAIRRFHQADETAGRRPERSLVLRQLLGRLQAVCNAVAYAHSRGVLHRDLKPANVMLGPYGETLVVDWGLAKPLGQAPGDLATPEEPLLPAADQGAAPTQVGEVVGTPAYMSPEQVAGMLDQLGPASDVYSLGATLYCLLTGKAPVGSANAAAVLWRAARGEFPPPRQVKRDIAPALEAICLKAMALRPEDRYASARELADEIERWLADEPVRAYRESLPARLARWGRHHRVVVASAAVLLLSAVVGLGAGLAVLDQANRRTEAQRDRAVKAEEAATAERDRAVEEGAVAAAVNDFLQNDLLRQADSRWQAERHFTPDPKVTVRELVDRAAAQVGERFQDRPRLAAAIHRAVGDTYLGVGAYDRAVRHLSAAQELSTTQRGADHPETLATQNNLGLAYQAAGRTAEAIRLLEQVHAASTRQLGPYHRQTLEALNDLAGAYRDAARFADAIRLFEQGHERWLWKLGPDHPQTLLALTNRALAYRDAGRTAEAIGLFEQLRDQRTRTLGPDHPSTLRTGSYLAGAYQAAGRTAEAIRLYEQVRERAARTFGPDHPDTLNAGNNLAAAYLSAGRAAEAVPLLERVRAQRSQQLGADHPDTLATRHNLAKAYRDTGRTADAIELYEQVGKQRAWKLGPRHPDTLQTLHNLAGAYQDTGRVGEAIPLYEWVREQLTEILGPNHPHTLVALHSLAGTYLDTGRAADAVPLFEHVRAQLTRQFGPDHPHTRAALYKLGLAYRSAGRAADAVQLFEQLREQLTEQLGPDHRDTLRTLGSLALTLQEAKQFDRAAAAYRDLLDVQAQKVPADDPARAGTLASLGMCLLSAGKPAEAEPVLRDSLDIQEKCRPDDWMTFQVKSLLGGSLSGQRKYAEAEALLLAGYQGMEQRQAQIPPQAKARRAEAVDRLIRLYEDWGKPAQAAAWRAKRD